MLIFPSGEILNPGSVVVIANRADTFYIIYSFYPDFDMVSSVSSVPVMIKYSQWSTGNVNLSDSGDEVLILDGYDNIVDVVAWGTSKFEEFQPPVSNVPYGHSVERFSADCDTNGGSDWRDQPNPDQGVVDLTWPTPTPTMSASITPDPPPESGVLLISEVMYIPLEVEPDHEWIEIYNAGGASIDLTQFKIGDEETQGGGEGMLQFPSGASIGPGKVIVIANQVTVFWAIYGSYPDYEMIDTHPDVPVMFAYLHWADGLVNLGNAGDEVLILDLHDSIVDAVSWGNSDFAFDPPVPSVMPGHSIERFPADVDTDTNADWVDQPSPNPGAVRFTHHYYQ